MARLVTGDYSGRANLLESPGFTTLFELLSGIGTVRAVSFSPNGQYLAVAHESSPYLRILNTQDWSTISGTPTLAGIGYSVAFSPDGQYLAVGHASSPYLRILNTSDWSTVSGTPTLAGIGYSVAFSPDGQYLAVAHTSSPRLRILNTSDWSTVSGTPTLAGTGYSVAFSPDGQYLAVGHAGNPYLRIINTSDWSTVSGTPTLASIGYSVAFSPGGQYLAIAHSGSPYLRILNTSDWSTVSGTPTLAGIGRAAAFSPDGQYLAVGHSGSPYLTVLNISDWSVISGTASLAGSGYAVTFEPEEEANPEVRFTAEGRRPTGQFLAELSGATPSDAIFSSAGRRPTFRATAISSLLASETSPVGFYVIPPYEVQIPTDIVSTNVPADDEYNAWVSTTTYGVGDVVTTGTGESTKVWISQFARILPVDSLSPLPPLYNENIDPTGANVVGLTNEGEYIANRLSYNNLGQAWWIEVTDNPYFANRYRMFSDNPSQVTEYADRIEVELRPQEAWNAVALINVSADYAYLSIENGPEPWYRTVILKYDEPISADFPNITDAAFVELPTVDPATYPLAKLVVHLYSNPSRVQHLGMLAVGLASKIGLTTYESQVEIIDFSRKDRDTFGEIILIERGWSAVAKLKFELDTVDIAEVRDFLASRRAKATVYVGAANREELIVLGYYRDFNLTADDWANSIGTIEIESFVSDRPANSLLPVRAVFIDPQGTNCITADRGATKTLCLGLDGRPIGQAHVSILNRAIEPGEVVTWVMTWLSGATELEYQASVLSTDCDQSLPLFTWPMPPLGVQVPGAASIKAVITLPDLTEIVSEPAILTVSECKKAGGVCLFNPTGASWVIGEGVGSVLELDAFARISNDGNYHDFSADSGVRFFYYKIPQFLSSVTFSMRVFAGAPILYAKKWRFCDSALPSPEDYGKSGTSLVSFSFSVDEWLDWDAVVCAVRNKNADEAFYVDILVSATLSAPT